jgi:hypothetical protein
MKLIDKYMVLLLVLVIFLTACTKKSISGSYDAQASVYFLYGVNSVYEGTIDSLNYSFVEKQSAVQQDTIWFATRITGSTTAYDRAISLLPETNGTTAVAGVHYKLLPYTMPKNSFQTNVGIVLIRDASLRDTSYTLTLSIRPNEDFPVLMKDTLMADGAYYDRNRIKIVFTDRLIKPANWDTYLIIFFGAYSNTKFRFIASVLGVSSFPTTGANAVGYPTMQYYQNTVRNALLAYNAANGALIDENGNPVVIP